MLLQELGLALVDHDDGPADRADIDRDIIQVQHQDRCADQYLWVGPSMSVFGTGGRAVNRGNLGSLNHSGQYTSLPV